MEQNFQTSFIPKKPMVEERAVPARSVGLFVILSIFALFSILLATVGLFFYKGILVASIAQKENELKLARNRFEPAIITKLQVLDKRLRSSNEILGKHIALTPIFQALQNVTMKTVRYTKFSYALEPGVDEKIMVKMSGEAVGYLSVALQSDLFTSNIITNKNFIDPVFSNLKLDDKGNVIFELDFSVAPTFVDYKQTLLTAS